MRRLTVPVLAFLALSALTAPLPAQAVAPVPANGIIPRPANDSIFRRARRMVLDGNGVTGRALVDSLLAATVPGSTAYGNALYWHGALASTVADAERDYRRVIVEFPLAYYADDALLAIAELEQGRGDRAAALAHLQRFVHEHPASPARGIAALGAARLAFEQRDSKTACAMIAEARASAGPGDVELTNQIAYYTSRCPALPPTTVAKTGSVPTAAATVTDTQSTATVTGVQRAVPDPLPAPVVAAPRVAPRSVPAAPASPAAPAAQAAASRVTIQLAAFNTRPEAEQFAARLAKRGLRARVSGVSKPFRVRLGFYATMREAAAEVSTLKARGIVSFVTEETPSP